MADNKTPASKTPAAPKNAAPVPAVQPLPSSTPLPEEPKTGSGKEKRPVQQSVFATAEEAQAAAEKRTYGPRKAYTVSVAGTTVHCVAYGPQYAAYEAFVKAGGTINDLGGTTRARALSEDALLAALAALPEEKRKALQERMAALKGTEAK